MQSNELLGRARELWLKAGLLSPSFELSGSLEKDYQTNCPALLLMIDAPSVGKKGSMFVRCYRRILVENANDENLKAVIDLLYSDVAQAVNRSHNVGVRF